MNRYYYYGAGALVVLLGLYLTLTPKNPAGNEKSIVDTTMPALDRTFDEGARLYAGNCAQCHGKTLGGVVGNGPPFIHRYYNSGHHSDAAFYQAVTAGVQAHHWQFGNMPKIETLKRDQIVEIIKYIRAVQGANGLY